MQRWIEDLLKENPSYSYSKDEIINLLSSEGVGKEEELEKILGEIEIWSSMKDRHSPISSSCKGGSVYFRWEQTP